MRGLDFRTNDGARVRSILDRLPDSDNTPAALRALFEANLELRELEWPDPFGCTTHHAGLGDARELGFIPDNSVHLIVTSPPYWVLKQYNAHQHQLGAIADYTAFLHELDRVWGHCYRVLVPGGRVCCVVGDVCLARKQAGRHQVVPLHADIQVRARQIGFENLTPILWHKIANGAMETEGNGAGFYGKPYQPGAIIKNDIEYILFFRKGGKYRSTSPSAKAFSMLTKEEMQSWFRSVWTDVSGASTAKHPAPFPEELASRLIRMFSFAGDTILDPFLGTGTTLAAAMNTGRSSIGVEIDPEYLASAAARLSREASRPRYAGATRVSFICDTSTATAVETSR